LKSISPISLTDKSLSTIRRSGRTKLSLFAPFGQRVNPVSGSPRFESYPQYLVVTRNLMAKFVLIAIGTKRSNEPIGVVSWLKTTVTAHSTSGLE
jgi:hypothetical protein